MAGPNKPKSGARIQRATWVAQAVELAIKGWSYRRIAARVGKGKSAVAEALHQEFERVRPRPEEVETLRNIQREQLQRQLASWVPRSLRGNKDAALVVARFLDRAAKLDGLDAPDRAEHTGKDGGPIVTANFDLSRLSDEQIDRLADGDISIVAGASGGSLGSPAGAGEGGEGTAPA